MFKYVSIEISKKSIKGFRPRANMTNFIFYKDHVGCNVEEQIKSGQQLGTIAVIQVTN